MESVIESLIKELKTLGVTQVIICPGGRNKVLLDAFQSDENFQVEYFFDERSASFYALGLSLKGAPVVVLTTSGSAVAECLPAVIEAKYQNHLPLIILSADRPKNLRYTGAPQTIPQQNIFNDFVESKFDFSSSINKMGEIKFPAHINLCLEDPNPIKRQDPEKQDSERQAPEYKLDQVVILSQMKKEDQIKARQTLGPYEGLIVLEALSGLKEEDFPKATVVRHPDELFKKLDLNSVDQFFRIGAVPVLKAWREIDAYTSFYLEGYFPGAEKTQKLNWEQMEKFLRQEGELDEGIKTLSSSVKSKIELTKQELPQSEVSLLDKLFHLIPEDSQIFIGNSLPIREVQYVSFDKNYKMFGQRGVNGIDGSLSFALGARDRDRESWIILGDLTCLYDLQGFWNISSFVQNNPLAQASQEKIRIVVINNGGGHIFNKIFKSENMINRHSLDFKALAEFWGLKHRMVDQMKDLPHRVLIEVCPNEDQSMKFWEQCHL